LDSGEVVEVSYKGFDAIQFEAQAQPNPENKGQGGDFIAGTISIPRIASSFRSGYLFYSESPQARFQFTFVELNSKRLFIYFEAPIEKYEQLIPEVDRILNSIEFFSS
jgi:hypothetical protein